MRVATLALAIAALAALQAGAQEPQMARGAERFPELDWLVGEWQGYGTFAERTTYIHKSYRYEVGGMFLAERTLDMFPPPEPATAFEIHQDLGLFYRDGDALAMKSFFVESYVTTSTVTVRADGVVVIESLEVENGPPGMRSRITIARQGADGYEGRFELAMPATEYGLIETLVMRRVR